jgi:hypothetical protein
VLSWLCIQASADSGTTLNDASRALATYGTCVSHCGPFQIPDCVQIVQAEALVPPSNTRADIGPAGIVLIAVVCILGLAVLMGVAGLLVYRYGPASVPC